MCRQKCYLTTKDGTKCFRIDKGVGPIYCLYTIGIEFLKDFVLITQLSMKDLAVQPYTERKIARSNEDPQTKVGVSLSIGVTHAEEQVVLERDAGVVQVRCALL